MPEITEIISNTANTSKNQKISRNVKVSNTQRLVECAFLIAMGVVLSLIKLIDLPYGGSVTLASMLPILLISYRHGIVYGVISAGVYGGIQQLLGLKTLSYVSTWQSVLAVILLDYIIAFAVIGLGGIFRRKLNDQALELCIGAILVCLLRYLCHFISGVTVWTGFALPTLGATVYSLAYNATYMVPEAIILTAAAFFIGSSLDFRFSTPVRIKRNKSSRVPVFGIVAFLILTAMIIIDVVLVFSNLQNADTGEWDFGGFANVNWIAFAIVTAVGTAATIAFALAEYFYNRRKTEVS